MSRIKNNLFAIGGVGLGTSFAQNVIESEIRREEYLLTENIEQPNSEPPISYSERLRNFGVLTKEQQEKQYYIDLFAGFNKKSKHNNRKKKKTKK